jgi:transposase
LASVKAGEAVSVGIDMGKHNFYAVCRWWDGRFERPWKIDNPGEILAFVELLKRLGQGRKRLVAMESSGTYGDALRQALADAGIELQRVSGKAAHDYAEVFDGVPSQHDGKDAAVVAELAAMGKSVEWKYGAASDWDQELAYWVDWMISQRQILGLWQGRLGALLARHWPEATRVLAVRSVTLLKALLHYGSPQSLAADGEAAERLARWGGPFLD